MDLDYLWGGCYLHVASRAAVLALAPCARRLWDDLDIFSSVVHLALSSRSDGASDQPGWKGGAGVLTHGFTGVML